MEIGQIEDLRLFVSVVDEGSIARAAEALGIAKSAVSRRLQQLEDRHDIKLVDRQPRNWEVTKAGQELYQRALAMVADADDLDFDFMHTSRDLSGPLRVRVPLEFGMSFLKPTFYAFMQEHPEIDLTVGFEDRTVDLDRENYDLAVRITSQDWGGLSHIKLGETTLCLFARPSYLEKRGPITEPCDLKDHDLLHYGADRRATWAVDYAGKKAEIDFQPALNSNLGAYLVDAAVQGLGVFRMLDFIAAEAVQKSELVPILPQAVFPRHGIYLVHSEKRRMNRRLRAMLMALQKDCSILCTGPTGEAA